MNKNTWFALLLCKKKACTNKFPFLICFISSLDSSSSLPSQITFFLSVLIGSRCFSSYWQQVNSTVGWIPGFLCGTVRWTQQEGRRGWGATALPLVYLKVRIVFVLTILTTSLPPQPAAQRCTSSVKRRCSDISVSPFLFVFFFFFFL